MRSEVIEILPLGAFVIDQNHRVDQWNGVIEEWTRVKREDIEGRCLGETFKRFKEPRYLRIIADCFTHGGARVFFSPTLHKNLLPTFKPDGSPRTQVITLSPFREDGKSLKGLVTVQDITDLAQAQQALEKEKNLLNTVFDVIPHAIFVKDKNLRYVKVNRKFQEFFQIREEDILGKTNDVLKGLSPSEKLEAERRDKLVLQTNQPHHQYEMVITDIHGRKVVRNSYKVPLTDSQRACVGVVGINEDTTELVQAQRRVRALERMEAIGQVVGGVCHNINNINQIISGNLQLLAKDITEENNDIFRSAHSAIDRASTLLDNLLNYTQHRLVDPFSVIVLNDLIKSFLEKPEVDIPANIRLESETQDGLWPIVADRDGFPQVLRALVENACQAMPDGGVVRIETRNQGFSLQSECPDPEMEPGNFVTLAVSDTGHGMSLEVAQKAFEPFFTTGNLAVRSGLGLSRVFALVKHARGHILIKSDEGQGTTVQILFPKSQG